MVAPQDRREHGEQRDLIMYIDLEHGRSYGSCSTYFSYHQYLSGTRLGTTIEAASGLVTGWNLGLY